jgi:hypothetical protein
MSKRGNGEGGITRHKKSGLYMARYMVQTAAGSKRKTIYGKTRSEVAAKLSKALADREEGFTYDAAKQTVEEYLARWLSNSVRDTVRQRTYERYESIVRVHLAPAIGKVKLKALTPDHVRGLYREKLDGGLALQTVLHIHRTLSKALKQATDDGLIPRNAAAPVKPPRPPEKRYGLWTANRSMLSSRRRERIGWKPSTSWLLPPGSVAANCRASNGKIWTSKLQPCRSGARSPSPAAGTSSRPPRAARDVISGSPRGPRRPSESTVSAS